MFVAHSLIVLECFSEALKCYFLKVQIHPFFQSDLALVTEIHFLSYTNILKETS